MAWKPEGYTSVAPYLVVDGAQRTIDLDQGGLYCFGLCLASILVGWTSFLRRDVN